jgi:hypothetical protein
MGKVRGKRDERDSKVGESEAVEGITRVYKTRLGI